MRRLLTTVLLAGSLVALAPGPATATRTVDRGPASTLESAALAGLRDMVSAGGRTYALTDTAVRIFAPGASAAAAPERTIEVDVPEGQSSWAIAVGRTGITYVLTSADLDGASTPSTLFVYDAAGALVGEPLTNEDLELAQILDITDHGDGLALLDNQSNAVEFWALPPTSASPVHTGGIDAGSNTQTRIFGPTGIDGADDGRLVVYGGDWVSVFAAGADGDVAPQQYLQGAATRLGTTVLGGGLDAAGSLYVGSSDGLGAAATGGRVLRFAPGATGDVAPEGVLTGPASGLSVPFVEVVPSGGFLRANLDATGRLQPSVATYRGLGPYAAPGAPLAPKVGGKAKAAKRSVTWQAAPVDADVPVTGYGATVTCKVTPKAKPKPKGKGTKKPKPRTKVVLRKDLPGSARSVVVRLGKVRKARCAVVVVARNDVGSGAAATTGFTVRR